MILVNIHILKRKPPVLRNGSIRHNEDLRISHVIELLQVVLHILGFYNDTVCRTKQLLKRNISIPDLLVGKELRIILMLQIWEIGNPRYRKTPPQIQDGRKDNIHMVLFQGSFQVRQYIPIGIINNNMDTIAAEYMNQFARCKRSCIASNRSAQNFRPQAMSHLTSNLANPAVLRYKDINLAVIQSL